MSDNVEASVVSPVDSVIDTVVDTVSKSTTKPLRIGGKFKSWSRKNSSVPEGQYYLDRINFHLDVLREYLERVAVRGCGASELDIATKVRLANLYGQVLVDSVK